ncbi:MAG: archease [Candidatus Methanomethylophilaceae archaeon]|nr:archease [Candidatus Methanomethylophilaceae archaeon]
MRYQLIDHTADVMVRCTGDTLEECFANAAYAMFDQMVDASSIDRSITKEVVVEGKDDDSRLYAFLSELLFIMDCEGLVFNGFEVSFEGDTVRCIAQGEVLDPVKHRPKAEIKAVTYHMLNVDRIEPSVTVIFDV